MYFGEPVYRATDEEREALVVALDTAQANPASLDNMKKVPDPEKLSVREWVAVVAGLVVFLASTLLAVVLPPLDSLPPWTGWLLAVAAILGLLLLVTTTVRALLRTDHEGVERQEAARASMVAVLVIVVAGYAYALLEGFAGLPRLTAAVPATAAALVWMIAFAWNRPEGDV